MDWSFHSEEDEETNHMYSVWLLERFLQKESFD